MEGKAHVPLPPVVGILRSSSVRSGLLEVDNPLRGFATFYPSPPAFFSNRPNSLPLARFLTSLFNQTSYSTDDCLLGTQHCGQTQG